MSYYDEEVARLHHEEDWHKRGDLSSFEETFHSYTERLTQDLLSEDEIYCSCLLKTLWHTATPFTVGFYSPHKIRAHSLMDQITGGMLKESIRREESQKSRRSQRMSYLTLLWSIVFYQPVITKMHHEKKPIKFLVTQFSAWEYACSNQLWAGLVTTLCDHICHHFGPLPLSFYRVVGSRPQFTSGYQKEVWRLKRKTCCIAAGFVIVLLAGAGLAATAFLVPGLRDGKLLKYLGSGLAVILGSGFVMAVSPVIKHLIISQKKKIESMTSNEKFTKHLGFRSAVKNEIEVLTSFIYYMEVFERRHFRIVLKITSLDVCYPEQVVGMLNAINTLLSDRDAPFIFILMVDPSIIVSCLEQASSMKGMVDNGYLYLNRMVTLPFSIPEIILKPKMQHLDKAFQNQEDLIGDTMKVEFQLMSKGNGEALVSAEVVVAKKQHQIDDMATQYIREAFDCLSNEQDCLYHYVPDAIIQMRRIINTVPITIRLMTQQPQLRHNLCPREVAAWVVLANQWPCRLSWILQCMEDKLHGQLPHSEKQLMWDVFVDSYPELISKHQELQNIIAMDGDPEPFKKFLSCDFCFNVEDGKKFLMFTVNLDHSIRYKMRQLQGLETLENKSKSGAHSKRTA